MSAASAAPGDSQRLLALVRGLARELQPHAPELERLTLDHSLERDFGLDSLARTELLARIERELGLRLTGAALASAETPRDLLRLAGMAVGATTETAAQAHAPLAAAGRSVADRPPDSAATLLELLDWHVAMHGEQVHITLDGEGADGERISYAALRRRACAVAAGLQQQGLAPGDKVAIMLPTGSDFFDTFYGALYAGGVPVPLYPPARPAQIEDHMRRSAGIVANAEAVALITVRQAKPLGQLLRAQCGKLRKVLTVADLRRTTLAAALAAPRAADVAFLQYTSGSTGNPKGVVLTHANLLANLRAMERASGVTAADTFVSWLPLYHDMGLIGACMGALAAGFPVALLSPQDFLARPASWLWSIHRHRATVSAAPNFAFALCADKVAEHDLAGLDLSCWRLAYNGAEPISPDTIERFAARLAPYGFDRHAMTPVYGLAESSVGLAFPPPGRGPQIDHVEREALTRLGLARPAPAADPRALRLVSCGLPLPGHQIRISDGHGRELPERRQGHVQFCGPSATSGYYRNPDLTARLFDGPWLNTGDMGYVAAGELYLTGREKDLIIRAGHHLFPQELEDAIGGVRGVRKGSVAVFPATDARSGTERLVVLAETREEQAAERSRMRGEINHLAVDLLGMPVDDIVLAPPRTVLKTSSGKLRRAACRELYERGRIGRGQRAPWLQMLRLRLDGAGARLRRLAYEGGAWLWAGWAWTVFVLLAALAALLIVLLPGLSRRRQGARGLARAGFALAGLWPRLEGLSHLARAGPHIVVANHASYADVYLLTAVLPPRFRFVAKHELLRHRPLALVLRRLGCVFVERDDVARGAEEARALEALVRAGDSLVLFPEGTFGREPGVRAFHLGAFQVATRTNTPVVPVALVGTRSLLRDGQWRPRRVDLRVGVGAPLPPGGSDWPATLRLREAARSAIVRKVGEPDAAA